LGVVCPHAGYLYSRKLAAQTLSEVNIGETVVLSGPNHHGRGSTAALSAVDGQMPGGRIGTNRELCELLTSRCDSLQVDEMAHRDEHSLEVQLPLLQRLRADLKIVPLVVGRLSYALCEKIGAAIASAIEDYQEKVLIVVPSGMRHYESRSQCQKKDSKALQAIEEMDAHKLYNTVFDQRISMCGVIPVTITLLVAKLLGASGSILVGYTDSGYVSGNTTQVVGYAGVIIS
jgi:AmmeMemoRadiSam system protein B